MPWTRDTPWRQGHLLDDAAIDAVGIRASVEEGAEVAVVISHDCDLAADVDKEPEVEVLVARRIDALDGGLTRAKNPRLLHVELRGDAGSELLELKAQRKVLVAKEALAPFVPRPLMMSAESRGAFQVWLAARYRRSAFPNAFETRLRQADVDKGIAKLIKGSADLFIAVLADLDKGEDVERVAEDDIYELGITVLYDGDQAGAREAGEDAAIRIEKLFQKKFHAGATWKLVKLSYCDAVSDEAMTVALMAPLKPLYLDYLSVEEQ